MNELTTDEYVTTKKNKTIKPIGEKKGLVIPCDRKVPCAQRAHKPGRETAFSKEAVVNL